MSSLNSISNGFSKDVRPCDIIDVVIVVSIIVFLVLLNVFLGLSHRKMLKDRSVWFRSGGE